MLLVSETFKIGNTCYERFHDGEWYECAGEPYDADIKVEDEDAIDDLEDIYQQQWSRDEK